MMSRFGSKTLVLCVVIVCAGYCLAQPPMPGSMHPAGPAVKDPNIPADTNTVVISYGPEKLTLKEILYFVPEAKADYIKRMAEQWLDLQLLYEAAKQKGVTNDPKAKLMADLNTKQVFAREVMTKVANEVNVPESEVREYYEKNKTTDPQLSEPNKFSFTHIRVKTLAEANAVMKQLKAGEDPSKIAKEVSTAPDAKNGGMVKKIPQQAIERGYGPEFLKALESASEGQTIGPIASNGEFEIARHEGKLSSKVFDFEQVKPAIKSKLEQKAKGQASQKYLETLKQEAGSKVVKSELLTKLEASDNTKSAQEQKLPVDKSAPRTDNRPQSK